MVRRRVCKIHEAAIDYLLAGCWLAEAVAQLPFSWLLVARGYWQLPVPGCLLLWATCWLSVAGG
jgi:hypothetical protein